MEEEEEEEVSLERLRVFARAGRQPTAACSPAARLQLAARAADRSDEIQLRQRATGGQVECRVSEQRKCPPPSWPEQTRSSFQPAARVSNFQARQPDGRRAASGVGTRLGPAEDRR